jgi:hypothetical protein
MFYEFIRNFFPDAIGLWHGANKFPYDQKENQIAIDAYKIRGLVTAELTSVPSNFILVPIRIPVRYQNDAVKIVENEINQEPNGEWKASISYRPTFAELILKRKSS